MVRGQKKKIQNVQTGEKRFEDKGVDYFVYIVCILIYINFEQCTICSCVLLRFFIKLLNNVLV